MALFLCFAVVQWQLAVISSYIKILSVIAATATTIAVLSLFLSEMAVSHEKEETDDKDKKYEALEVHDKSLIGLRPV